MANRVYAADQNEVMGYNESSYGGSQQGSAYWFGHCSTNNIIRSEGKIPTRYIGAGTRNIQTMLRGPIRVTGVLTFTPQDWRSIYLVLGKDDITGSTPWTHTVIGANGDHKNQTINSQIMPSFQIEDIFVTPTASTNFKRTVKGCMVDSWNLTLPEGLPAEVVMNYVAQDSSIATSAPSAVTEDTTEPYLWSHFTYSIGGNTIAEMTNYTLAITNGLVINNYINQSRLIGVPNPGPRNFATTVTFNATEELTAAIRLLWINNTASTDILNGEITNAVEELTMTFSNCYITEFEAENVAEGVNVVNVTIVPTSVSSVEVNSISVYA